MEMPMKRCKTCNIEKPKIKFSGRSAKCCMCMYAKNKEFFQNYYVENNERLKTYEKDKYHLKYDAIPKRKRGGVRKVLVVPEPEPVAPEPVVPEPL